MDRFLLAMTLPDDDLDGSVGLGGEAYLFRQQAHAGPNPDLGQARPSPIQAHLGVLGGATDVVPASLGRKGLQRNIVELTVAQHHDRSGVRQELLQSHHHFDVGLSREMPFAAPETTTQSRGMAHF